jgi:SAM-dependent methyltransferase
MSDKQLYNAGFYKGQSTGSVRSALAMMPFVLDAVKPASILDVGCGIGSWASVCIQLGVDEVCGIDGNYVDQDSLLIPKENFVAVDLTMLSSEIFLKKFDLILCLEVAEHLPSEVSDEFIQILCNRSDNVLFSAAIPNQGGTGHLNEQWQSYWAEKFATHGYRADVCVRNAFWKDRNVESWYRQNVILYRKNELGLMSTKNISNEILDVVHPDLFLAKYAELQNLIISNSK